MRAVRIFIRTVAHTKIYMRWTTVQNVLDTFAAEVLRKRKAIGYTQRQLADKLHMSIRTIQDLEHGISNPKPKPSCLLRENWISVLMRSCFPILCEGIFQKPLWISSPERVRQRFKSMCPCVNKQISWKLINEQPFTKISGCFFFRYIVCLLTCHNKNPYVPAILRIAKHRDFLGNISGRIR